MQLSPKLEEFLVENDIANLDDLKPFLINSDIKNWLDDRNINDVAGLKRFIMYSALGSITNHNVRANYVDLTPEQLSKMNEYLISSVYESGRENAENIFKYQKRQFENWRDFHNADDAETENI